MAGMGRWLAVGSELPCSVIIMTYLGSFLGTTPPEEIYEEFDLPGKDDE
jgi:hypothetical protein